MQASWIKMRSAQPNLGSAVTHALKHPTAITVLPILPYHGKVTMFHAGRDKDGSWSHTDSISERYTFRQVKIGGRSWVAYSFVTTYALHLLPPWGEPYIGSLAQDYLQETSPEFTRFNGGIKQPVY